jgi:hypothetical protein
MFIGSSEESGLGNGTSLITDIPLMISVSGPYVDEFSAGDTYIPLSVPGRVMRRGPGAPAPMA